MYYFRTGDTVARQAAVNFGSYEPTGEEKAGNTLYSLYVVDPYGGVRLMAYLLDAAVAKWQVMGSQSPQDALQTRRYVDSLLGILDQNINYDPTGLDYGTPTHPQTYPIGPIWRSFMLGLEMEALIEYYDRQEATKQEKDQRIPVVIKSTLDFMWSRLWADKNSGTEHNNLVCGGFAWYWSVSSDDAYFREGDARFDAALSPQTKIYWTGKDFGQIFKWSFDYIGWSTQAGYVPSTFPEKNQPSEARAPFPDTVPPIPRPKDANSTKPDPFTGTTPVIVNGTSVTITWSTYEQLSWAEVLYGLSPSYGSTAKATSVNCSAVAACNAGCATAVNPAVCKLSYVNSATLNGLKPGTTYHFATWGADKAGNVAQTNPIGGTQHDFTFSIGSQ